jgi:hypothetical protein
MNTADERPYQAKQENGTFVVQDDSGRTMVTSHDQSTADNFVVLLNAAYHKGYKAGYRDGKNSTPKKQ